MSDLPSGTVTFLFTDIEGSTRLLDRLGPERYSRELARHQDALRRAFQQHDGVEVDTQGDGFFVAFHRAADAVAAAAAARHALETSSVRVRMGIHTGEPLATADGYVGMDVHRAARIAGAAHGAQIVLSETTRNLLDEDVAIRELGAHRLKDLTEAERLYQLGDGDFPPLRTLDSSNLPVAGSPLIGREKELEELVDLLSDGQRLVTITGPGGTGKTRLALQAAAELSGAVGDGVFWVPLAGLADPALVGSEIAQPLGAPEDLIGFLRGRKLLILLDNFEHLLEAAPTVSTMLAAAPELRVLVTSRAALRVADEHEFRLEPLASHDAAALFIERARAVGREVEADATVEAICRRLDGLPLAIELAAARTKLLAPERLLERLDVALPLLTAGARDAPERQRTLRATIEWSYDLLDDAVKELFARLSVFAGSFPLEGAEEVGDAGIDGIATLVDSSLLKPIGDDRFLMLETIREYALDKLDESDVADGLRRRHADFFCALAERAYQHRFEREAEWSERLETDHDDLRAALDWSEKNDADRALALAGALGWFWLSHAHLSEGGARLSKALGASAAGGAVHARALTAQGSITGRRGALAEGRAQLEAGIRLWREVGDRDEVASALDALGWLLFFGGENALSLEAFERSLELRRDLADRFGEVRALVGVCQVLVALGQVDRAEQLSRELLELADDPRTEHFAFHFVADCALIRGDALEAGERYRESLVAALPLGDVLETSFEVQGIAMAAAGVGETERPLLLAGSVAALWDSHGTSISVPFWDALLERYIGGARERLGSEAERIWAEGLSMPFDDAVQLALQTDPQSAGDGSRRSAGTPIIE